MKRYNWGPRCLRAAAPVWLTVVLMGVMAGLFVPLCAWAGPKTQGGPYTIEVTTNPGIIPVGKARLQIKITDASGKPVEGATVRALTKMPSMDMGEREQSGAPQSGQTGLYEVPAQFAMEGGYQSTIKINGPLGSATATLPLQTGQDTTKSPSGGIPPVAVIGGFFAVAAFLFIAARVRRTGQAVDWKNLLNAQLAGSLLLLGLVAAGAVYATQHWRRPGALTPVQAQAMDMSYLPPPPGFAPVELGTVTRGAITKTVRYTGTATGFTEQEVYPRTTGTLLYLPSYAGDRIRKGQMLARLDTSQSAPQSAEKQAAADAATQGISVAQAETEQAQAEVGQAHAELAGKQGALGEARAGIEAAREEREGARATLAANKAQADDARAQVTAAQADQTYWQTQITRSAALLKAGAISGAEFGRDKAQADTAAAKVKQAQAQVSKVSADVGAAQAALRRADALIRAAGARTQMARSELDAHFAHVRSAQAALTTAGRKVGQARSGATQAQAQAQAAAALTGYAEIRSPNDGVVTQRLVSPGTLVSPGQALLRIAQIDPIRLQANVAQADLTQVRVGSLVQISAQSDGQASGRKPVLARVSSIAPAADPAARTTIVEVIVPNPDRQFVPGQFVEMAISTGSRPNTLRVPSRALSYGTSSAPYLWVADSSGTDTSGTDTSSAGEQFTVRRVGVQVGLTSGTLTEIIGGVKEGERVVVSGGTDLKDGDTVAAINNSKPAAKAASAAPPQSGEQTARVTVTADGFVPASLNLRAGVPARITFLRDTDKTCATEVVFPDYNIRQALPLRQPVTVTFTPKKGELGFACGMNMVKGKVIAQ